MKRTTTMTIAALVIATIATGAAPAFAEDQSAGPTAGAAGQMQFQPGPNSGRFMMRHMGREEMGLGGGMLAVACSRDGADRLEHMLLTIEQRTDPTAEQQPLYDTLKSSVTKAQSDFAAACAAALPDTADSTSKSLADRLKMRLEVEKAHVEAMTAVIPAFEAFYNSLSDAQKQALEARGDGHDLRFGEQHRGGRDMRDTREPRAVRPMNG